MMPRRWTERHPTDDGADDDTEAMAAWCLIASAILIALAAIHLVFNYY